MKDGMLGPLNFVQRQHVAILKRNTINVRGLLISRCFQILEIKGTAKIKGFTVAKMFKPTSFMAL